MEIIQTSQRNPRKSRPGRRRLRKARRSIVPRALKDTEVKYNLSEATASDIADTGTFTLLNGIGVGTDTYQRIGRQIRIIGIELRASFYQQNGALNPQPARYMIAYDRQCNGAVYTLATLLDNSTGLYYPFKNTVFDNQKRFSIVLDKTLTVNPITLSDGYPCVHHVIKCNLPVQYNGTAGLLVSAITSGSLYLIMCDVAPVGAINIRANFSCRILYLDV